MSELGVLLRKAPRGSALDTVLATRLGALYVFGLPGDLKKLDALASSDEMVALLGMAVNYGISPELLGWIERGERGTSSNTIFSVITGFPLIPKLHYSTPCDADDFRRCRLLCETSTEMVSKLHLMNKISPAWNRLVSEWVNIYRLMDEETPQWRYGKGNTPRTNSLIKGLVFHDD